VTPLETNAAAEPVVPNPLHCITKSNLQKTCIPDPLLILIGVFLEATTTCPYGRSFTVISGSYYLLDA
jgi:hypothetical protein